MRATERSGFAVMGGLASRRVAGDASTVAKPSPSIYPVEDLKHRASRASVPAVLVLPVAWFLLALGLFMPWFTQGSSRTLGIQLDDGETLALLLVVAIVAGILQLRRRTLIRGILLILTALLAAWITVVDAFTGASALPPYFVARSPRSHVGSGLYLDAVVALGMLLFVVFEARKSNERPGSQVVSRYRRGRLRRCSEQIGGTLRAIRQPTN